MKALISPTQGGLISQVEQEDFPIAEPLYWIDCPEFVKAGWFFSEGQFIDPAPAPPKVMRVEMAQARLALLQAGLLSGVTEAINALPSPQKEEAEIEWEFRSHVSRDSPLVQILAPALGLAESQMDDLFSAASRL